MARRGDRSCVCADHERRLSSAEVADIAKHYLTPDAVRTWVEDIVEFDEREARGRSLPSAAVAICTRERPDDLDRTLRAVSALDPRPREVLVIDNAPATAHTKRVASYFPGVRYIVEPRQGLNRARNRALRDATADVVAFTDDPVSEEFAFRGVRSAGHHQRADARLLSRAVLRG